jgi:hypothetical protein
MICFHKAEPTDVARQRDVRRAAVQFRKSSADTVKDMTGRHLKNAPERQILGRFPLGNPH